MIFFRLLRILQVFLNMGSTSPLLTNVQKLQYWSSEAFLMQRWRESNWLSSLVAYFSTQAVSIIAKVPFCKTFDLKTSLWFLRWAILQLQLRAIERNKVDHLYLWKSLTIHRKRKHRFCYNTLITASSLCHKSSFNPCCNVHGFFFLKTSYVSLIYKCRIVLKIFTDPFLSYTLPQRGEISNISNRQTKSAGKYTINL